jgi:AcrR family transcriptional regulator
MPPELLDDVSHYRHGRVPRAVRERQVLALAEELFAERGYEGASMDELARRAGVSKPVIYGLAGSKENLYRRCFERAADELEEAVRAAIAEHPGLADRLEAGTLAFFRFIDDHRGAWAQLLFDPGPGAEHVERIRARQARLVGTLLREAVPHADCKRLEAAASALNGVNEGLASWWRANPEVSAETLTRWALELIVPGLLDLVQAPAPAAGPHPAR